MAKIIQFGRDICQDFAAATSREWLETNGLGGFASSTIIGLNTRRYHALLTAATAPPVGRVVLLSKLEETLVINGDRHDLSANQYPNVVHPRGFELLDSFRLDPFPVFTYQVGEVKLRKFVFMIQGENTTVVQYGLLDGMGDVKLGLRPLIAFRDFHSITHENTAINTHVEFGEGLASMTPYPGLPTLYLAHNAQEAQAAGDWYRNFEYEEERRRGLDFREDLLHPLTLTFDLSHNETAVVIASTQVHHASEATSLEQDERQRRTALVSSSPVNDDFVQSLTSAADQFIARRGDLKTIIAGYHWFGDWGRDTMISLPGLTLVTGKYDIAREILLAFAEYVDRGMLPNVFPDAGQTPEYNTADATLWYFHAIREYGEYTGDFATIEKELYPVLVDIVEWHIRGTRYGLRVDDEGLLLAGEPGVQLTWMDAKVGDWVVTPRIGKPVEIQALWYNALRTMEEFAERFDELERAADYRLRADQVRASFNAQFWNPDANCLYDVIGASGPDSSIRPNQVFAVSLPFNLLESTRAKAVVDKIQSELLTPFGLRTLSPNDRNYIGAYSGNTRMRDGAYHQGTVWPWLLGPFLAAYLKVYRRSTKILADVNKLLQPMQSHLLEAGLGSISEIFSGDAPHTACGCVAQAWSVAEILRALVENVQELRPEQRKRIARPAR
ncbi:MAG: amylo-alpha-1,6-glucosidase [Terriglobales bacterium]